MTGNKLQTIYAELSLTAVFKGVLNRTPFPAFFEYCEGKTPFDKRRAYAEFISEVYEEGGNLTELLIRRIYEDENVYVKEVARGKKSNEHIINAVEKELITFSSFASLRRKDFAEDMGEKPNALPDFDSFNTDMVGLYKQRLQNIDKHGYGVFSCYPMFRYSEEGTIDPIISADKITLNDLIGYETERGKILENTKSFLKGKPAANALLCGDAGTGKSSTVKAVTNEFFNEGLRLIELRKDQLKYFPTVMGKIADNPLKFIIFIDDLSFNKSDDNFSALKAALEGSASAKADNAVIYATSNRRHIIKESFGDREGDDVHRNDTMQELLSLSERFGLTVLFSKPNKALYLEIVKELAKRFNVQIEEKELELQAEAFALRKGNRSARCAQQFIKSLL